ncbi:glycosyltransferase family 2 protein [Phocaeicola fibrisolvens]|uniref:glycosyltransferase family 2 protein n=1 Tax=Phocaeicola fibrisolvens TaxID=2981793 RepID=UPI0008230A75|nr:glycosyltransferase [Phocaeicola fibrisolvens]MCU6779087.1 glycosyltransferase [Phocaeicola fibrisolvens]SCI20604.1 Chondroitin polymerase [uncultured Bacteroides sp.]
MPKISIVVPVYNAEKYLPSCVNSILAQTLNDIQIILVDDGSKDNSGKICDDYQKQDKRINVIHQKNSGVMKARAEGVRVANGEWVCFIDADDMVAPDALECMYSYIANDIDIVVFESPINASYNAQEYIQLLFKFQLLALWGKLYRRNLLNDYALSVPAQFKVGEDFICQLRILCMVKSKIRLCSERKYIYNENNPASVQKSHRKSYEYEMAMLSEVADIMDKMNLVDEQAKIAYLKWRIVYLGGMIGLCYSVDYKSKWVIELENECRNYSLSGKDSMIMNAIHIPFLRLFLILEKFIKGKGRWLINKFR